MIDLSKYDLLLFDVDGTIVKDYNATELLPSRKDFFEKIVPKEAPFNRKPHIAFVSNQGGVGLRYYLIATGNRESAKTYPSQKDAYLRLTQIVESLGISYRVNSNLFISYSYQAKGGDWLPTPYHFGENYQACLAWSDDECDPNEQDPDDLPDEWSSYWRKPNPGMLIRAMRVWNALPEKTLMIGDRPEDEQAAANAKVSFMRADRFFEEVL